MEYTWRFGELTTFIGLWMSGVGATLFLTVCVIIAGTALAGLTVLGLASHSRILRLVARGYVDLFRAIPALVLIGTLYFCLPLLLGFRISAFQTAFVALSINLSPFAAECIRAGIESLPKIHYDSTRVIGFSKWQRRRYITGPLMVRRVMPPLLGQYITTLKLTSLAATVGVAEIWHVTGQVITASSLPVEARLFGAGLYVAIVMPLIWLSMLVERRFRVAGLTELSER